MDDFEYSVDICDRDWECFFAQCEECNVLSPSLARLEDSGMSDMDDLGAFFAKSVQKVELKTGFLEEDVPVDGPLVCEASPTELYLGKHSSGGMESVLSGSEEDIHLQSVNMFFERIKSLTDSQKTADQSQVGAIKNRTVQEELSRDGQLASCNGCTLPRNNPKLNSGSARGEAAAGMKTVQPVGAIHNTYTIRTDESGSESSTSISVKHPYLKTQLFIGQESNPENTVNDIIEPHDSLDKAVCSTPHFNKVMHMSKEMCTCDVRNYSAHQKTPNTDSCRNPDLVVHSKWTEDKSTQVSQSDTESTYKPLSKESSPCASVKRKRRKKRRLNVEPAESVFACERLYDSEDELFTWRRAIDPCFSKDCNWSGLKDQRIKCGFMSPLGQYSLSSSLPAGVAAKEIRMKDPLQPNPHNSQRESIFKQAQVHDMLLSHETGFAKLWPSTEPKVKEDVTKRNEIANSDSERNKEKIQGKKDSKARKIPLESVASSNNIYRNEVKSITNAIFLSAESNNPEVDVGQSDRESTAKSVMREEPETEKVSQCQRETEPHQQLESQCPIAYQSRHMVENMTPSPSEAAISTMYNVTDPLDHKIRHHASQTANMASDNTCSVLDNDSPNLCNIIMNGTMQKTKDPIESVLSQNDLSLNQEIAEVCEAKAPQDTDQGNLIACDDMSQLEAFSESEDLSSYSTLSSCRSPEAESVVPLSVETVPQTLESSSVSYTDSCLQKENSQMITKGEKIDQISQSKSQDVLHDAEEPCWDKIEVAMTTSQSDDLTETIQNSDHRVFAMSSFWKEMEKLTINDILGLRKENNVQSSFLPPLQETDDADYFTLSDSGCCTQAEERKLEQDCMELPPTIPNPEDSYLSSVITTESSSSRNVLWDSEPVPMALCDTIYKDAITMSDISEPIITPGAQKGLRRMSKNVSVQNLHILESKPFNYKYNSQTTLKPLDEDKCNIGYILEDPVPKRDSRPSSITENFRISISDIYTYFFGEKQPDTKQESPTDNIVKTLTDGESVPENYDHFFSEFDTDNVFYTDEVKPELVPIFSCTHSSNRKVEFPDAYDYFLVSSSDNSSAESDEENTQESAPIRVVTRFTRKASSKDIVTDAYEHFYTDGDLKQDFFKTSFSFRNSILKENNVPQKEQTNALGVEPLKCESRSFCKKAMPITVLGNQDLVFPDALLYDCDDQIITKLQQPLMYENLQAAVVNPRLDAPLLPLKQSDMCLICIAFASWVLKTANPQVGDAWKAVLLANVSALSAIRYLRKYVKVEATVSEKKPNLRALCSS